MGLVVLHQLLLGGQRKRKQEENRQIFDWLDVITPTQRHCGVRLAGFDSPKGSQTSLPR